MYRSIIVLTEDIWEISFPIGVFEKEDDAEYMVNYKLHNIKLDIKEGEPVISYQLKDNVKFVYDHDITIKVINEKKQKIMGRPLDASDMEDIDKAIDILMYQDPSYSIDENDMELFQGTLLDFIERYGIGYIMNSVAYKIEKIS